MWESPFSMITALPFMPQVGPFSGSPAIRVIKPVPPLGRGHHALL